MSQSATGINPRNIYPVSVDGVGDFTFRRRTMRDEMRIQAEFSRSTEGVTTPTLWQFQLGTWLSSLRVLMVSAPEGFDIDEMDPLEEETFASLEKVFLAFRDAEDTFRGKPSARREASSAGTEQDSGVLVSPEVQPTAE